MPAIQAQHLSTYVFIFIPNCNVAHYNQGLRQRIYTSFAPGSLGQGPTSTLYINSTCDWTQQATKRTRSDGSSGQKVKWIKIYIWIWAITRQIAATNVSPTHNP